MSKDVWALLIFMIVAVTILVWQTFTASGEDTGLRAVLLVDSTAVPG